jgi:tetratricopeptide (TPR) repeat protein
MATAKIKSSIRHPWLARLALAVGLPAALLLALELGLRVGGYGRATTFMIPDEQPGYLRTNPDFASLFLPGNFDLRPLNFRMAAHKAPGAVRIVVLGESAAQGIPVPSFAFAPQVRAQLRANYPGKEFEVINTGIVAINSHVIYQIAREMARYEPDLFLVYMGNNEVVGPYGPGCAYLSQMPPLWVIRSSVFVRSTRTGQLLGSLVGSLASRRGKPAEWGGMSMFVNNAVPGDDPRLEAVYSNFTANLRGIIKAASGAGAKVVLCTPVANLRDCPPFLSVHKAGMSEDQLKAWKDAFDEGKLEWLLWDRDRARACLGRALEIDPQYAETSFLLGDLDVRQGETAAVRGHFVDALRWDALRFRPDPRICEAVRNVAKDNPGNVVLLDSADALGADLDSTARISGRPILFEHVHFDWHGNFLLGRLMAQSCATALFGPATRQPKWLTENQCAEALAYTGHERLPMLLRIDVLVRKPPFTNQLSHLSDEARFAADIRQATSLMKEAGNLAASDAITTRALASDPDNPALAGILEGIKLDTGDTEGALVLSRRAARLLPRDFALSADEASILMRLGKNDEAKEILMKAAGSGADLDMLAPVLADYWTRTGHFSAGLKYLGDEIARRPRDIRLRIVRAGLLSGSGDERGALAAFNGVLDDDPSSEDALESVVALLTKEGHGEDAAKLSLARAPGQPRNQANSLRAVQACEAHGDEQGAIANMKAAELSGPVTSTFELTLALKLYKLGQDREMMEHLAQAQRMSALEGNPTVTASIGKLLERMSAETKLP